jgi:hypothetical protein
LVARNIRASDSSIIATNHHNCHFCTTLMTDIMWLIPEQGRNKNTFGYVIS